MCTCKVAGLKTCHCASCHQTFASLNGFDWHQKMFFPYGPVCVWPEDVTRRDGSQVLFRDSRGYWREHRPDLTGIETVMKDKPKQARRSTPGASASTPPSSIAS